MQTDPTIIVTALIELIIQLVSVSFNFTLISSHIVNTYLRLIVTIYIYI